MRKMLFFSIFSLNPNFIGKKKKIKSRLYNFLNSPEFSRIFLVHYVRNLGRKSDSYLNKLKAFISIYINIIIDIIKEEILL